MTHLQDTPAGEAAAPEILALPAPALEYRTNPVRVYPDMALRTRCRTLAEADLEHAARLGVRMREMVRDAGALGLAAPQIGVGLRMFCFRTPDDELEVAINPVLELFGDIEAGYEGCLSLGQIVLTVKRPHAVVMRYLDTAGEQRDYEAEGLWARVLQHEADHLDGRLIIDIATDMPALFALPYEPQVGFWAARSAATRHLSPLAAAGIAAENPRLPAVTDAAIRRAAATASR